MKEFNQENLKQALQMFGESILNLESRIKNLEDNITQINHMFIDLKEGNQTILENVIQNKSSNNLSTNLPLTEKVPKDERRLEKLLASVDNERSKAFIRNILQNNYSTLTAKQAQVINEIASQYGI